MIFKFTQPGAGCVVRALVISFRVVLQVVSETIPQHGHCASSVSQLTTAVVKCLFHKGCNPIDEVGNYFILIAVSWIVEGVSHIIVGIISIVISC